MILLVVLIAVLAKDLRQIKINADVKPNHSIQKFVICNSHITAFFSPSLQIQIVFIRNYLIREELLNNREMIIP